RADDIGRTTLRDDDLGERLATLVVVEIQRARDRQSGVPQSGAALDVGHVFEESNLLVQRQTRDVTLALRFDISRGRGLEFVAGTRRPVLQRRPRARRGAALRQRWAGGAGQQPGEKYLPDHPFLPFPVPLSSRGRQGGGARRPRRCTASADSFPCPPAGERDCYRTS